MGNEECIQLVNLLNAMYNIFTRTVNLDNPEHLRNVEDYIILKDEAHYILSSICANKKRQML